MYAPVTAASLSFDVTWVMGDEDIDTLVSTPPLLLQLPLSTEAVPAAPPGLEVVPARSMASEFEEGEPPPMVAAAEGK